VTAVAYQDGYTPSQWGYATYLISSSSVPFIYSFAGNGRSGYSGDGGLAKLATLNGPSAGTFDSAGNFYFYDIDNHLIRKIAAGTGIITTVAGNVQEGCSGDNGPATSAELYIYSPSTLAVDSAGNLYFVNTFCFEVSKIAAGTGIITTYAGGGYGQVGSSPVPATSVFLDASGAVADPAGNLYISNGQQIFLVTAQTGMISVYAGTGVIGDTGDNGPALSATFDGAGGLALDASGNLYIADEYNNVVRRIDKASGIITTIAGNGTEGTSGTAPPVGDNGPATSAELYWPNVLAIDSSGNLYIEGNFYSRIREVAAGSGIITTAAGNGDCSSPSGAGGPAPSASVCFPFGLAVDASGRLYFGMFAAIELVTPAGPPPTQQTATPVVSIQPGAYSGTQTVSLSDATPQVAIYLTLDGTTPGPFVWDGYGGPITVSSDVTIRAMAAAPGYLPSAVQTFRYTIASSPALEVKTLAGSGQNDAGIGDPTTDSAEFGYLRGVAVDSMGNIFIADSVNYVVWKLAPNSGSASIYAGTYQTDGYGGDDGPAASSTLSAEIQSITVDGAGNLYIADAGNCAIRKVTAATAVISTVAGIPTQCSAQQAPVGDNGPATSAQFNYPNGVLADQAGNLYISDTGNNEVRYVSAASGTITDYASANLFWPTSLALDQSGNLFVSVNQGTMVDEVATGSGTVSTYAGNGDSGQTGDGGTALTAEIGADALTTDAAGNLYIANGDVIRVVSAETGIISDYAGNIYGGYSDGPVAMASLSSVSGLAFDSSGNLIFADGDRVREVTAYQHPVALSVTWHTPAAVAVGTALTATQLDATATVPGTFTYSPSAGTVVSAGTQTLSVTFTPDDMTTYTAVTKTVSLQVYQPSAMLSPAAGSTLSGPAVTFSWSAVSGATGYHLWIGSTGVGSNDIYNSALKTGASYTFTNMPINGEAIYVRLITSFSGAWISTDYIYTAAAKSAMLSPAAGSTFTGSAATFTWSAEPNATGYYLWIGSIGVGSNNLYNSALKTTTTYTFNQLPTNGETVYLRLITNLSGTWVSNDYTYKAASLAELTSPAIGSTFSGSSVTFTWSAAPAATDYYLWIGSTGVGSNNIYNSAPKAATSYTFTAMPTNGETIYVRLITNLSGTWRSTDYTFRAAIPPAAITSPASGSVFSGVSQTFTWTPVSTATDYYLWIGSTGAGSNNIYNSKPKTGSSYTFTAMPTNGETIYVRLITNYSGTWVYNDYVYTAAGM